MKDPIILRRTNTLTPVEASYWKDLLYRAAKIGTELEVSPPKRTTRPDFETALIQLLHPSGSLEDLSANGVLDVKAEHCGVEIRIIGRHPHFRAIQRQYAAIMNGLINSGARARPTCGLHFHLLTPGLAEPVPEIVLANLWNLTRRYAPELRFLTSGGDKPEALCRRRNHTSHLEMVKLSPATMTMAEIQQLLNDSQAVPKHQNFLNLEHIRFTPTGQIHPFHLEFRFPDASLSATAVTAKTFLFLAMLLKAVDLSQYGVIHVGKIKPWQRKIALLNMLSNNDGNLATSDTSQITPEIMAEIQQGGYELLDLLASTFERFEDNPAMEVLLALVDQPLSLRRCAGYTWPEIEAQLAQRAALNDIGLDKTDQRLMQRIELGEWHSHPSADAWHWHAAHELYLTPQDLERRLQRLAMLRGMRWDTRQGTMVFTS